MLCWRRVQGYRDGLGCHPRRRPEAGEPEDFAEPRSLWGGDRVAFLLIGAMARSAKG